MRKIIIVYFEKIRFVKIKIRIFDTVSQYFSSESNIVYCYKIVTYTKDDSQTIVKKLHPRAVDAKFQHVRVHIRRLMRHSYDAARIYIYPGSFRERG